MAAIGMVALVTNTTVAIAAAPAAADLTLQQKFALLQQHVKYVFVIFHENESFDHFFGTFPSANGLFSAPAGGAQVPVYRALAQKQQAETVLSHLDCETIAFTWY